MKTPLRNRVARFLPSGEIHLEPDPMPEPGPGEAVVRTRVCGICSGDLMGWYLQRKAPLVFGHEVAGEIAAVGAGVNEFRAGDRVFVHHHAPCFECRLCLRGDFVHCATWRSTNIHPGGMAEFFRVPRANLAGDTLRLPESVDFEAAALVEPTACVVKSLRRAGIRGGERLVVIGLGIMGQLHVVLARRFGAAEIIAVDLEPARCERARSLGADWTIDARSENVLEQLRSRTGGDMAEVVIVGPGSLQAIELGLGAAAPGGRVVLFTTTRPEDRLPLDVHDLYFREVSIIPSYSCGPTETREALDRIARGEIPVGALVTHRYPIEEVATAYRTAGDVKNALKTLVVF